MKWHPITFPAIFVFRFGISNYYLPDLRSYRNPQVVLTLLLSVSGGVLLLIRRIGSPGIEEPGDGVFHYQYARYSWEHPEHLLDTWAKPLFTLLSSPFAQLGLYGMTLFNVVLIVVACVLIARCTSRMAGSFTVGIPFLLLSAPMVIYTVTNGMTEVLFGSITVAVFHEFYHERPRNAAIIASFLVFARPEVVAVLPFIVLWMLLSRQWKAIPWLLLGNAVYALCGLVALSDPWWWYRGDPYTGGTLYGSGDLWHFVDEANQVLGEPLKILYLLALPVSVLLAFLDKARRHAHIRALVLAGIPPLAILAVHSYAWYVGGHSSLGLIRVLATGVPLVVLFTLHVLGSTWQSVMHIRSLHDQLRYVPVTLISVWSFNYMWHRQQWIIPATETQRIIEEAGEFIGEQLGPSDRLIYLAPYLGSVVDVDPWDHSEACVLYDMDRKRPENDIRVGDIVGWDTHLCPQEGRWPLERLLANDQFHLLKVIPTDSRCDPGNSFYQIWVFRKV